MTDTPHPFSVIKPEPGTILAAYRGSVAHGMYVPKNDPNHIDDIDIMGFVVGDLNHYFGLSEWASRGTREYWREQYDCVYYDIRKAVSMLLAGNPNIFSILWLQPEHYLLLTPEGKLLLENRDLFVGKHIYNSFAGYASAQLKKMESRDPQELQEYIAVSNELKYRGAHPNKVTLERPPQPADHTSMAFEEAKAFVTPITMLLEKMNAFHKKGENLGYMGDKRKQLILEHGYDAKNAAHCIRLLRMCKEFLSTGVMQIYRTSDRQELLDIKAGKWSLESIKRLAEDLFVETKQTLMASPLPEKPEHKAVEGMLVDIIDETLAKRRSSGV